MQELEAAADADLVGWYVEATKDLTQAEAGGLLEMGQTTYSNWKAGARPSLTRDRRQRVIDLLAGADKDGRIGIPPVDHVVPAVASGSDLEHEWWAAYMEIRRSDASAEQKMLDVDALSGVIARIAWARDAEAAKLRAQAVISGDDAATARAKAAHPHTQAAPVVLGTAPGRQGQRKKARGGG